MSGHCRPKAGPLWTAAAVQLRSSDQALGCFTAGRSGCFPAVRVPLAPRLTRVHANSALTARQGWPGNLPSRLTSRLIARWRRFLFVLLHAALLFGALSTITTISAFVPGVIRARLWVGLPFGVVVVGLTAAVAVLLAGSRTLDYYLAAAALVTTVA